MKSLSHWIEKKRMYESVVDSSGVSHMVCHQLKSMSCGMACVAMVVYRVRGIRLIESNLRSYSACFYQGPGTDSKAYNGKNGTEIFNLAIMLKKFCIPCDFKNSGRAKTTLPGVSTHKPIIALVQWNDEGAGGGGGHFIVIDAYNEATGMAVVCDPYYGLVETALDGGSYSPNSSTKGMFNGNWIIVS